MEKYFPDSASSAKDIISVGELLTTADWRNRICEVQRSKMSPDILNSLKVKAERQKRAQKSYKTAEIMERCNVASARAQEVSLRKAYFLSPSIASIPPSVNAPGAPPRPSAVSNSLVSPVLSEQLQTVTMKSSSAALNVQNMLKSRRAVDIVDNYEEEDRNYMMVSAQLQQMEADLEADEVEARALPAQLGILSPALPIPDGFDALLESLATEPTDSEEMATKFAVFDNFLNTVVALREQTVSFWHENRDQFEGSARSVGEKSIRDIDNQDSMSIVESSSKWFVYFMMKKAHQNSQSISNTLAAIKARLDLLAKEDIECPFCLEPIVADSCTLLGCCHKTCTSCWKNWQELKGASAFCPLCRHEEFVQEIFA